jgi:hypothetical protein
LRFKSSFKFAAISALRSSTPAARNAERPREFGIDFGHDSRLDGLSPSA